MAASGYTTESLGAGHPMGGTQRQMHRRYEVLNKLRTCAFLSFTQRDCWTPFCQMWDKKMREEHKTEWGMRFAEYRKHIMTSLQTGDGMALSRFMENERLRVLANEVCLIMPAIDFM